jgi:hypothetical protein
MFKYIFILSVFISTNAHAQDISAFSDANRKLYEFNSGRIKMIEFQEVQNLQIGNKYLAYSDARGDYFVRWNGVKTKLSQGQTQFFETHNYLVAQHTSILKVVDNGEIKNLTSYVNSFGYGDSIIVFQDRIGGNLKYYYQDTIIEFAHVIGDYDLTGGNIGDNVFAYQDNAGNYYGFSNSNFYKLFSANQYVKISAGLNLIAYNDPETRTFAVFQNGEIQDVENEFVTNFETGRDFVYFFDQSATHKVFYHDEVKELGYDLENVEVHDSLITFREADYLKIWYDNEIYTIFNSRAKDFQADNGTLAYFNDKGGVSAFRRGKEIDISNQKVEQFWLNGNTIVIKYSASAYSVWWNGKMFNF